MSDLSPASQGGLSTSRQSGASTHPEHVMRVLINEGAYPHVECPFDPADESRPCWPYDLRGEPCDHDEGVKTGCVYSSWVEEIGMEAQDGSVEVRFTFTARFGYGDDFSFTLGEVVHG